MEKDFINRVGRLFNEWQKAFWQESLDIGEYMVAEDVAFVCKYVATMLLAAHVEDNFKRIEKFLELQMPKNRGSFHLIFLGGECGHASVRVNDISIFDFADAWLMDQFLMVSVKSDSWKTWTKKRLQKVLSHIREDFAFDGYIVKVYQIEGEIGQPCWKEITVEIEVSDWTVGFFRQAAAMKNYGLLRDGS